MALTRRQFILSATGSAAAAAGLRAGMIASPETPILQPMLVPMRRAVEFTPTERFFHQHIRSIPALQHENWSMFVDGLVATPLMLTYEDVCALSVIDQPCTMLCIGNPAGGRLIGHGVWQGVPLSAILQRVGVSSLAQYIHFYASDGYATSIRIDQLGDALLALSLNGQVLTPEQGFPARIIVPSLYGYKMPKWIHKIEMSETPLIGFWEGRGWAVEGDVQTTSAIFSPSHREAVSGNVRFSGIAYAGSRTITRVELSVDGGAWMTVPISASQPYSWTHWQAEWMPPAPGQYLIRVRASDSDGNVQDEHASVKPFPNGASGLHAIVIQVTD